MNKYIWPIYAPLKINPDFSADLIQEVQNLQSITNRDPITYVNKISRHDINEKLSQHLGLTEPKAPYKNEQGQLQNGTIEGFRSLNLTYIDGLEDSKHQQFYKGDQGQTRAYLFKQPARWVWRDELQIPEIKKLVATLPIKELSLIRLIYLIPPAEGGVHIDTSFEAMENYYKSGGGSLTFNLLPGDGALHFLENETIKKIDPNVKAWHFNPSTPHSVGHITKLRIQLRVFGYFDLESYRNILKSSV